MAPTILQQQQGCGDPAERQQIADRVAILAAVETMERHRTAGVRRRVGRGIELALRPPV